MPGTPQDPATVTLTLEPEARWTLHHVLLHRLEEEATAESPTSIDPPPVAVFEAFETLDGGETTFTIAEAEAIQSVLAEYHHSTTWWELERSRLEQLLRDVTELLDRYHAAEL